MNSSNLKIFCVTNKKVNFVKKPQYYLSWVGLMKLQRIIFRVIIKITFTIKKNFILN